ncbi:MAG TPA: hypothetical protein VEV63_01950 [Streptosporangiaceae bacterium]|nr:hypothetical protein [Streptosporangiaceae bacterium]
MFARISPAAVAVALSLLIGGAGFADAATGGTFILGKVNKETSTASLADSKGIPLALSAPAGKAPLAVNRDRMVKNLNSQYLGGLTATALAETGGEGFTRPTGQDTPIGTVPTAVASTGKLPAGTYYVSATAYLSVPTHDVTAACWIAKASAPSNRFNLGAGLVGDYTVAETAAVNVSSGDALQEMCDTGGTGSIAVDAGIVAIRVLSSSHK